MEKKRVVILQNKQIAKGSYKMILASETISQQAIPGQFIHILIPHHLLRRPISIAEVNKAQKTVTIIYKVVGKGTKFLAHCEQGDTVDVLGPNGNGFDVQQLKKPSTVLLVGGGVGIPPVYFLGKTLKEQGHRVLSILGFQSKEYIFYADAFNQLGQTKIVTEDGSYGTKGVVTDVIDSMAFFDLYFTCGPLPMIQAVIQHLPDKRGYISLEERMGCGVGACLACVLPSPDSKGYQKICEDGPVFSTKEVIL